PYPCAPSVTSHDAVHVSPYLRVSPLQYHLGNGAGRAVSKRQVDVLNTFRDAAFLQIAIETQTGFTQSVATYLDIAPTHVLAQTCAKGFEEGFLGSEACGIT